MLTKIELALIPLDWSREILDRSDVIRFLRNPTEILHETYDLRHRNLAGVITGLGGISDLVPCEYADAIFASLLNQVEKSTPLPGYPIAVQFTQVGTTGLNGATASGFIVFDSDFKIGARYEPLTY